MCIKGLIKREPLLGVGMLRTAIYNSLLISYCFYVLAILWPYIFFSICILSESFVFGTFFLEEAACRDMSELLC